MRPHHINLLSHFFVFLTGMVIGAISAHDPRIWLAVIILTTIAAGLMGASTKGKRKRRSRSTKPRNAEAGGKL